MRPFTAIAWAFCTVVAIASANTSRAEPQMPSLSAPAATEASKAASLIADLLLQHLSRGAIANAYALFVDEIKEQVSIEDFTELWKPLQRLGIWAAQWKTVGLEDTTPGILTIELAGILKTMSGGSVSLEATIIRERGSYRMVCLKFKQL